MKTKLAILIKPFDFLDNWELRIIDRIKKDSNLELSLLIKDDRHENVDDKLGKDRRNLVIDFGNNLANYLFKNQMQFENKRYSNCENSINKEEIFEFLYGIPSLSLKPKQYGTEDIFTEEDCEKIEEYGLDVILKNGFNDIISGRILNSAKHGIWDTHCGGYEFKNTAQAGLLDVIYKNPVVTITLHRLTEEEGSELTIDVGHFNRSLSFIKTRNLLLESSVSLIFKNIKKIENEEYVVTNSKVNYKLGRKSLNSIISFSYCINFQYHYFKKKYFKKMVFKFFGIRYKCWTLFIGNGDFMDSKLSNLKPTKLPKGEFWADPFLFKHNDEHYVFFENYSYTTRRGKISCGLIKNNEIINIVDVLNKDYHLSYPFVFEEDGDIFMMPESNKNKRLEIYKSVNFPKDWELFTTAFEGECVADASFYNDSSNRKWLFLNKKPVAHVDNTSELHIYKIDSIKLNDIIPHKQNPVIIDSRVARNGGAIFEYKNKHYRPSQSNTDGVYGKAFNINEIIKLDIDHYVEKNVSKVEANFQKGFIGIHHLHQNNGKFIFDAAYKRK